MDDAQDGTEARLAHLERESDRLEAELAALRMLVTSLMAKWALENADDPKASAFRMFETMIGSLPVSQSQYLNHEPMVSAFAQIEDNLRFILRNVEIKLAAR